MTKTVKSVEELSPVEMRALLHAIRKIVLGGDGGREALEAIARLFADKGLGPQKGGRGE